MFKVLSKDALHAPKNQAREGKHGIRLALILNQGPKT
jgi:hypothetical protein